MKHRDRVWIALNHEEPDRCPMQIGFTPEFASRLRMDLDPKNSSTHNPHGGGNTYELERALDEDILLTSVGWANSYYKEPGNYTTIGALNGRSVSTPRDLARVVTRTFPSAPWRMMKRSKAIALRIRTVLSFIRTPCAPCAIFNMSTGLLA